MKSNYTVVFSSTALLDLKEAKQWYSSQQKGLGKRLIADVKSVVETIKINPEFASVKFENVRTAACQTFGRVSV